LCTAKAIFAALDELVTGRQLLPARTGLIQTIKVLKLFWSSNPRADDRRSFFKNSQKSLSNRMN
jgi:hypothetical protein